LFFPILPFKKIPSQFLAKGQNYDFKAKFLNKANYFLNEKKRKKTNV
jgi:hypothetical protein